MPNSTPDQWVAEHSCLGVGVGEPCPNFGLDHIEKLAGPGVRANARRALVLAFEALGAEAAIRGRRGVGAGRMTRDVPIEPSRAIVAHRRVRSESANTKYALDFGAREARYCARHGFCVRRNGIRMNYLRLLVPARRAAVLSLVLVLGLGCGATSRKDASGNDSAGSTSADNASMGGNAANTVGDSADMGGTTTSTVGGSGGGAGNGAGGEGGSAGTVGSGGSGGAGAGGAPDGCPDSCGANACCTADGECGMPASFYGCAVPTPGVPDAACPPLNLGEIVWPGCCLETGVCGYTFGECVALPETDPTPCGG
jgi:hypothetical protein